MPEGSNPSLFAIWRSDAIGIHTRLKFVVLRVRISRAPPLIKNIRKENVLKNSCFKNLIFFENFDILFIESQK